jgi:hypothetical protein
MERKSLAVLQKQDLGKMPSCSRSIITLTFFNAMAKKTLLKKFISTKNCRVQDMLDEEMSKRAGLAQQMGFGPAFCWLQKGAAKPNTHNCFKIVRQSPKKTSLKIISKQPFFSFFFFQTEKFKIQKLK